ncbi:MAG TPA: tRNA(Ile)(2)-agmatinylcytidine synthase [Candidatus Thermoplasmatota archaeon]|nr:tRNA(Ile)(2)-agmatinylcytidine synthase [Candidatus Thermoplasmatota archaeon]
MLQVAVDDTDSRTLGGCTTWLAARILDAFPECHPVGYPRLVRLNPCVPWKTRGNGALALRLEGPVTLQEALARVVAIVEAHARVADPDTSPAVAVTEAPVEAAFYWRAVRHVVPVEEARDALAKAGALTWAAKPEARGLVGCAGALAWPAERVTYELIAYRHSDRVGTPRSVDAASVAAMARAFPDTFDSYCFEEDVVVMEPASPCPVLYGIRATRPDALPAAHAAVVSEGAASFTIFETNQASDDHLLDRPLAKAEPYTSMRCEVTVASRPERGAGGHVFLEVSDPTGFLRVAAYEPTKGFRESVLGLRPGDRVLLCGSVMAGPDGALTLNLEKFEASELVPDRVKVANPKCPTCGKPMGSMGSRGGYRCERCRTKAPPGSGEWVERPRRLALGWHEVPACARRHLARSMGGAQAP